MLACQSCLPDELCVPFLTLLLLACFSSSAFSWMSLRSWGLTRTHRHCLPDQRLTLYGTTRLGLLQVLCFLGQNEQALQVRGWHGAWAAVTPWVIFPGPTFLLALTLLVCCLACIPASIMWTRVTQREARDRLATARHVPSRRWRAWPPPPPRSRSSSSLLVRMHAVRQRPAALVI